MNIYYNELITLKDIKTLNNWLEYLLGNEFNRWIRNFNLIEWTNCLRNISYLQLVEGFKNFNRYREQAKQQSAYPFPINCVIFKNFCTINLIGDNIPTVRNAFNEYLENNTQVNKFWSHLAVKEAADVCNNKFNFITIASNSYEKSLCYREFSTIFNTLIKNHR